MIPPRTFRRNWPLQVSQLRGARNMAMSLGVGAAGIAGAGLARAAYKLGYGKNKPQTVLQSNASSNRVVRKKKSRKPAKMTTVKSVAKQVRSIQADLNSSKGTLLYRNRTAGRVVTGGVGQQAYTSIGAISDTFVEGVIANLAYYDPSAPTVLITADGASGTYQKDFMVKSIHTKLKVRNNYQSPAVVSVYVCRPRADTSIAPTTAMTNGLTDQGNPTATSPLVYLTDSLQFQDLWKITKSSKAMLQPGEEFDLSIPTKQFVYDPSLNDSHSQSYQKRFGAMSIVIRVEGVIGHDSAVTTEQGCLLAGVDYLLDRIVNVKYDAGADLHRIVIADTSASAFTNNGLVSQKPVADNIGYNVA